MKQEENKERSTAREAGERTAGPRRFTPECITSLAPGEVFVFGSNLAGMQGGVETIKPYVDEFLAFARAHRELLFYVTRIGCGIAGFHDREIAPLFAEALTMENVVLPESFVDVLQPR